MAKLIEVPTFVRGEQGFAAKLNQLGDAVRELQALQATPVVEEAPKAAPRRKAPAKAE